MNANNLLQSPELVLSEGSEQSVDIFLRPGEHFWGDARYSVRTILGSCVAVCLWNPISHEGGMCHIMLPSRTKKREPRCLDGRYADEALLLLFDELNHAARKRFTEYEVKVFGGGRMFPTLESPEVIGERNITAVRALLTRFGMPIKSESLGGDCHRKIIFNIKTGEVLQQKRLLNGIV